MENLIAQSERTIGTPLNGLGPLGTSYHAPRMLTNILTGAIGVMTVVAGIWFVFLLITGGYDMIASEGDKNAITAARKKITTGLVGLVIVVIAIFLIEVVTRLLGIPNILNLSEMVLFLMPQ